MSVSGDILGSYGRVVIKVGSSLLVDSAWEVRISWVRSLVADIVSLHGSYGSDVVIVSSGAIAVGRGVLGFGGRSLSSEEKQACAATGQMVLSRVWSEAFADSGKVGAQMLLTLDDTEVRSHHVHVRDTLGQLLRLGVLAVINENDTVTQGDLRYGDNDRLAARICMMLRSDLLLLLSDIDGLYSARPDSGSGASHIAVIEEITPEIMSMVRDKGSVLASGGMETKLRAAEIVMKGGVDMIISDGCDLHPLRRLQEGCRHSIFKGGAVRSLGARKDWIRGSLRSAGAVMVDAGALDALVNKGKSLLPAGVKRIIGDFDKGDAVDIIDEGSVRRAVGLIGYDSVSARKIIGMRSDDVATILGADTRGVLIHRDDLVVL